jgi:glycosyltransferase involved in cell wall biosynthesis
MTAPVLSLIVPNHNHTERLPRLFDSILAQSFKDLEVILVDDCSDASCAPLVEAWQDKGLSISLLEHTQRIYTLQARLAGIRAAKGQIIAFADADDLLCGEGAMERNVELFLRHTPDILHFRFSVIDDSGAFVGYADHETEPRKQFAYGEEVFSLFAQSSFYHMAPLWNKYYSRELCNILEKINYPDSITLYFNDLCFNSLSFYHANKYAGSETIGYLYKYDADAYINKAKGRAVACYRILNFVDEYLSDNKCKDIYREQYKKSALRTIALQIGKVCRDIYEKHEQNPQQDTLENLLTYADEQTWMKILLLGNGYNADKVCNIYHLIN